MNGTEGAGAETIPGAVAAITGGIERGLHLGSQVYVSATRRDDRRSRHRRSARRSADDARVDGHLVLDDEAERRGGGRAAVERGNLEIDDRVADHIPEFAQQGKHAITLRHLLTHTAGIRPADLFQSDAPGDAYWEEVIEAICGVEPEDGWVPGESAGYHLTAGMTLLAEVVRRVDGRRFEHYVRDEIYEPLGMVDCWVGMPADVHEAYGPRHRHHAPHRHRCRGAARDAR